MLVELAIGDAYGSGFEYADDTQMSLAIVELILSDADWTPINIANKFVECFKRDWRDGCARGFQKFLEKIKTGQEFLEKINPKSDKSGGAMRATPIGLLKDQSEVIKKATAQAKLTHDTPDGIAASQASALLAFGCKTMNPKYLGIYLDKLIPGYDWDADWSGKVKSRGWMSVRAAVTAIKRNNKLATLLEDCINFTGDTDTVATIALGSASLSSHYINDINDEHPLYSGLEDGVYGKEYLKLIDQKILDKFGF